MSTPDLFSPQRSVSPFTGSILIFLTVDALILYSSLHYRPHHRDRSVAVLKSQGFSPSTAQAGLGFKYPNNPYEYLRKWVGKPFEYTDEMGAKTSYFVDGFSQDSLHAASHVDHGPLFIRLWCNHPQCGRVHECAIYSRDPEYAEIFRVSRERMHPSSYAPNAGGMSQRGFLRSVGGAEFSPVDSQQELQHASYASIVSCFRAYNHMYFSCD